MSTSSRERNTLDMVYKEALAHGFAQIVLLHIGFDTRALPFWDESRMSRIF